MSSKTKLNYELLNASCWGDYEKVKKLLKPTFFHRQVPDLNCRDQYGNTPLLLAAFHGRFEVARILVNAGADTQVRSDRGDTALHLAACGGQADMVGYLLNFCDVNTPGSGGETALHMAAARDHLSTVKRLLSGGADMYICDWKGKTVFDAAKKNLTDRISNFLKKYAEEHSDKKKEKSVLPKIEEMSVEDIKKMQKADPQALQKIILSGVMVGIFQTLSYEKQKELYQITKELLPEKDKTKVTDIIRQTRKHRT